MLKFKAFVVVERGTGRTVHWEWFESEGITGGALG